MGSRLRGNDEKDRAVLQLVIPAYASPLICHSRVCGNPSLVRRIGSRPRRKHSGMTFLRGNDGGPALRIEKTGAINRAPAALFICSGRL